MNQTISVIVPVFNVAGYLPQCVDSILSQDYGNLEVILIDDGSTDGSGEICDRYAALDSRVRAIHQKNGGAAAAKTAGLPPGNIWPLWTATTIWNRAPTAF